MTRDIYSLDDTTLRELAELRGEMSDVGGVLVSVEARRLMEETGTDPGKLAGRYLEDCARVGRVSLIGYPLDEDRQPRESGEVHVVLDPETCKITIYEEFY